MCGGGGQGGGFRGKEFGSNAGDTGSIPESERSLGEGSGNLFQYSCLGNPWTKEPGGLLSMGSQNSQGQQ